MAVSKKRKYARRNEKQYRMVEFTTEIFEDSFVLPDQQHFTLGVVEALNKGDIGVLIRWMEGAGVKDTDLLDAIRSLDQIELQEFIEAWGKGSLADAPKSGA